MRNLITTCQNCRFSPGALAFGLALGLAFDASTVAAADATNVAVPSARGPLPTKLVVPPDWIVKGEPRDYNFEGLPLEEVARYLQDQYKDQFDVLLPRDPAPMLRLAPDGSSAAPEQIDVSAIAIKLRLKSVTLVEVFQAMNMQFELERKPFRWELVMNGRRPVAALHILDDTPASASPATVNPADGRPQVLSRAVLFVGNLLTATPGAGAAMKPDALCQVLEETAKQSFPGSKTCNIQFHQGAELVVLSGTDEEVRLMKDVLQALTEKARFHTK